MDTKCESVWFNFENKLGDYLRVGINPRGAYNIKYVPKDNEAGMKEGIKLESGVICKQGDGANYECTFSLPYDLFPISTYDYRFQALHFHHVKTESGEEKEFVGAVCPSFEEGKEFCWKGCTADKRFFGSHDEPLTGTDHIKEEKTEE